MTDITSTITGEPVLIDGLHAVYFAPRAQAARAVLLVPPLFEEKRCAHRALITAARTLADAGVAVLHLDLTATGNSAGNLADVTLEQWIADVRSGLAALAQRAPGVPLTLVSCRAGALIAMQALATGETVDRVVLVQPVVAGKSYFSQLRTRRKIQDSITGDTPPEVGPYEVEGHACSAALHTALDGLRLPATLPVPQVRLLQCSFNEKILTEYSRLIAQWDAERVAMRCVVCAPFWNPHSPGTYADFAAALVTEVLA